MSKETFADKNKKIEDKVVGTYKKIEDGVVGAYKKIEDAFVESFLNEDKTDKVEDKVVGTYKKVEDSVVGAYKSVEDKFVDKFMRRSDETVEEAKERMMSQTADTMMNSDKIVEENLKKTQEIVNKHKVK